MLIKKNFKISGWLEKRLHRIFHDIYCTVFICTVILFLFMKLCILFLNYNNMFAYFSVENGMF